jgi:hypothetical protein
MLEGLHLEIASPFNSRCPKARAAAAIRANASGARITSIDGTFSGHHPT